MIKHFWKNLPYVIFVFMKALVPITIISCIYAFFAIGVSGRFVGHFWEAFEALYVILGLFLIFELQAGRLDRLQKKQSGKERQKDINSTAAFNSIGIFGIDRQNLVDGKTRLVVRRVSNTNRKLRWQIGVFLLLFILVYSPIALVDRHLYFYLFNYFGNYFNPFFYFLYEYRIIIAIFLGFLLIGPAVKLNNKIYKDKSQSFLFDDDALYDESAGNRYDRRFVRAHAEQFTRGYQAKTPLEGDIKAMRRREEAKRFGNDVVISHGAERSFLMHGIEESQASLLVDIINAWTKDPDSIHVHDL